MAERSVHVSVTGRVQGVGYRAWTREAAVALCLRGWVRNRRDGSVEALFAGADDDVAEMLERLNDGPRYARVTAVTILAEPCDADPGPGFVFRPTV